MTKKFMLGFRSFMTSILIALAISSPGYAGMISIGTNSISNPNHVLNFDNGKLGNNVSNQFFNDGLAIITLGQAGISLTSNNVCNNASGGMTNKYLYMGISYPCSANTSAINAVSILFSDDIEELSWKGFNRAVGKGYTIQAINNGSVVSSIIFNANDRFENKNVLFKGSVFNELRFTENGKYQGIFGIDDLAWRTVPEQSEVPLPGTISLLGIGMLGLSFTRKKEKPA